MIRCPKISIGILSLFVTFGTVPLEAQTKPTSKAPQAQAPISPSPTKKGTSPSTATKGKADSNDGKYLLRYKLKPGQVIRSEVTHLAKTDTKVEKHEQSSQSRTVSQKSWTVEKVEASGNMVFTYRIDSVDMSQQIGNAEEIKYNSTKDEKAPSIFGTVADSIGKPLSTVSIDPRGQVAERDSGKATPNLGMGDIAMVMPEEKIEVGGEWSVPREIRVRTTDGGQKTIKIRELHRLEKVSAGIATISIQSEPLTPITEPEIEAQVLQQLSNGTLRFDIDEGRLVSKELKWDEKVVGFSGPGSMMEYTARYSEEVKGVEAKSTSTASKPTPNKTQQ